MKRNIIITDDGSTTIQIPDWNEQYHSKHGAIQEANHVFLKQGLQLFSNREIKILEIGFGTGLNCLLTSLEAPGRNLIVDYVGIEGYPVSLDEINKMNFAEALKSESAAGIFEKMHDEKWEVKCKLHETMTLTKRRQFFKDISDKNSYNLIYFDAFGARVQPELWTATVFKVMWDALMPDGVLVTYSAKGSVRRAMQEVGFTVERLPGPPGKREMLRAIKKII